MNMLWQLVEWISTNGAVSPETALAASEECDKMLRMGDRPGRPGYDRKKLLLYVTICGCRRQIEKLLKDLPTLFNTIEDFLWFKLSALREYSTATSSNVLNDGLVPYTLDDLQSYLNKFEPSYYTKNGKDPLIYPYVLFLSIQLFPGILYLSKEVGEDGYHVDAVHISIALADHGVLPDGVGSEQKMGVMDACAEAASIIQQYGSIYLCNGNIDVALAYYAQAAAAMGGGEVAWIGEGNSDLQRQHNLMLKQLLTEILLRDGGMQLLLGSSGMGEEGELKKYMMDWRSRQQFLLEAVHQCQEAGLYDKVIVSKLCVLLCF
jgi:nuclear pore complex protein Nup93